MKQIKIKLDGVVHLRKLNTSELNAGVRRALDRSLNYIWEAIPPYPPPPSGSRYVRTGKLGQKFMTDVDSYAGSFRGWIGSAITYAPWVISREKVDDGGPQAWMHAGRWWTLQGVVESRADVVAKAFQDIMQEWINGI